MSELVGSHATAMREKMLLALLGIVRRGPELELSKLETVFSESESSSDEDEGRLRHNQHVETPGS